MLTDADIKLYHDNGYIIIRSLFSEEEIMPILEACQKDMTFCNSVSTNKDFEGNDSFNASFWRDPNGNTLFSKLPRTTRIVRSVEQLLDDECYYWRSRLVHKKPREQGRIEFHQDFSFWYNDGCVFPDMISCSIPITPSTRDNGCLEIIKGSHKIGRLDLLPFQDGAEYPDPRHIQKILHRLGTVYCTLEPGDGLFLHANTLHGSGPNKTDKPRIIIHNTYNAAYNEPIVLDGQAGTHSASQKYEKLHCVPDNFIKSGDYSSVFDRSIFFPSEVNSNNEIGIFKRG